MLTYVGNDRELSDFVKAQEEILEAGSLNWLCLPSEVIVNQVHEMFCPYCSYGFIPENRIFHSVVKATKHVGECRPAVPFQKADIVAEMGNLVAVEINDVGALKEHVKLMRYSKHESIDASFIVGAIDALKKPHFPFALYSLVDENKRTLGFTNYYICGHHELKEKLLPRERNLYHDAFLGSIPSANSMHTYVRRECRGRGYGKFLLRETISHICRKYHPLCITYDAITEAGLRLWNSLPYAHSGQAIDVSELTWNRNELPALKEYYRLAAGKEVSSAFKEVAGRLRNRADGLDQV